MANYDSLWGFIAHADFILKTVMIVLLGASVISWSIIFQRSFLLRRIKRETKNFELRFWSSGDIPTLFKEVSENKGRLSGIQRIFYAGYNEFTRLNKEKNVVASVVLEGTERAMRVAQAQEIDSLESNLAILATVGSTSPYVGLFGTVWGIMTSFRVLGFVQQATIAMVAPGISEALIATAMGLFAAIPAVIAYNGLINRLQRIQQHYEMFQEEFMNVLHRKSYNVSQVGQLINEHP